MNYEQLILRLAAVIVISCGVYMAFVEGQAWGAALIFVGTLVGAIFADIVAAKDRPSVSGPAPSLSAN